MAGRPPQEMTSLYNFQPIFGGFKFLENFFPKNVQVVIGHDKMIRDSDLLFEANTRSCSTEPLRHTHLHEQQTKTPGFCPGGLIRFSAERDYASIAFRFLRQPSS